MKKYNTKEGIMGWCKSKKFTSEDNLIKDMVKNKLKNNNNLLLSGEVKPLGANIGMLYNEKYDKNISTIKLNVEKIPTFNFPALPKLLYGMIEHQEKKNQKFNRVKLIEYTLEENYDTYISTSYRFKKENILEEWNKIIEGKLFLPIERTSIFNNTLDSIDIDNIVANVTNITIEHTDTTISIYGKIEYHRRFYKLGMRDLTERELKLVFRRTYTLLHDGVRLSNINRILKFKI